MSNIDWSKLRKAASIKIENESARLAPLIALETQWVEAERRFVGELLEAIEDGETVNGTDRQWRDYRTQLRAWKLGAEGYPEPRLRPARPS
ncbi:hypothetical protein [Pseudomonas veronii]|uniref:hypothetical protein n=1 Tax=Pseudomonas veronii TaxID=76761 RepID=UPI00061DC8E5|nr:hypothetical protein [Pseudomonas veronii]